MSILPKQPQAATLANFEFHELSNEYPLIEGDEFMNLVEDITKKGILEPIVLYQGKILDGRNRYRAAKEAGHKFTERDFVPLRDGIEPEEFVSSRNDYRRNLSNEQKQALIEKKINRHPTYSNRQIGKLACCDHKTVSSVRDKMKKRVETFTEEWKKLSSHQRREFVAGVHGEILSAMAGISPAQNQRTS